MSLPQVSGEGNFPHTIEDPDGDHLQVQGPFEANTSIEIDLDGHLQVQGHFEATKEKESNNNMFQKKKSNMPIIIGSVVAAAVVVLIASGAYFVIRQRRTVPRIKDVDAVSTDAAWESSSRSQEAAMDSDEDEPDEEKNHGVVSVD